MNLIIKLSTAALIAISFSSCQTMQSGNENIIPPVHKAAVPPFIVC